MPRALKRLRNLGNRHTATVQGLRLPLLCRSKLGPSAALVPTCPCCDQPCHHTLPDELPLKFGTHTQAVTGRLSTTPETHSVSTGESALADYIWTVKLVCRKLTYYLTGCEFSGEQCLRSCALVEVQRERRVRCRQKKA